jgi:hypothetical protein
MGSATAGKWAIGMFIYFAVFLTIVTNAQSIDSSVTYSGGIDTVSASRTGCYAPRYSFNAQGEASELLGGAKRTDYCQYTQGVNNENICTSLNGCTWTNQTSCFLFFTCETSIETCEGRLNQTFYDYTTSSLNYSKGICDIDKAQDNATLCEALGCQYGTQESVIGSEGNQENVFSTIGKMFTFSVDIGLPTAGNVVFTLFLFYLPFFILLLALYFALPFLH